MIIDELKVLMGKEEADEYRAFKTVDQKKLCDETRKADAVTIYLVTSDITQPNKHTRQ